jgi:carboxylesterase
MLPQITVFNDPKHQTFRLEGGKAAALLIHGFPGTPDEMRPLADSLHRAGWTTHAALLPGFGAEINTINERSYGEWLNTVVLALQDLKREHSPVIVVGNSMGGALSIKAVAEAGADALVLLAPFYKLSHILWTMLPAIRLVTKEFKPFKVLKLDINNPEVRAGILKFMPGLNLDDPETQKAVADFAVPINLINQIRIAGQEAYTAAPKVRTPTLVLQGRHDDLVRPEITQELISRLSGITEYIEVNGQHDLVFKDRPAWKEVEQNVVRFTQKLMPELTR